jgi:AraC family L-rhamnose operon transcriptional activator RhaR
MSVKRFVDTTPLKMFITPETPIYINRVPESYELAEHNHEFMEITYVSEGSGIHYVGGKTMHVAKGDLFYIPIGVSHVFRPALRQQLIVYNCLFGAAFICKLTDFLGKDNELLGFLEAPDPARPWFHWKDRDGTVEGMFNALYEEFARKRPGYHLMMHAELFKLLMYLRRCQVGAAASETAASTDDTLDEVIAAIRERIAEPPAMRELSSMAGLSERQFRRRFFLRTGMNYTGFVQKQRIELVCRWLVVTNEKVSAIARKAGYRDIKFFNRLFKQKTGMTPKQYRHLQASAHRGDEA